MTFICNMFFTSLKQTSTFMRFQRIDNEELLQTHLSQTASFLLQTDSLPPIIPPSSPKSYALLVLLIFMQNVSTVCVCRLRKAALHEWGFIKHSVVLSLRIKDAQNAVVLSIPEQFLLNTQLIHKSRVRLDSTLLPPQTQKPLMYIHNALCR